jgi:DNA-binding CsgD family transcriptional regulator
VSPTGEPGTDVERGREAYAVHNWRQAFELLAASDRVQPLAAEELEVLARSAYMLGRDDEYVAALERAHHAHVEAGDLARAARCTFWIGHSYLFRGQGSRAGGWFARGQRHLDQHGTDCVERGYLLIPVWLQQLGDGDFDAGYRTAGDAAEIGDRFGDADLAWLARDDQARALVGQGRIDEGLRLVDEILVVATSGELSPIVTGIVYCNTIAFCRDVYELRHAWEWTDVLGRWCERQPEMVAHNGLCLVHRAESMLLRGAPEAALAEARRSAERYSRGLLNQIACGKAYYCQGDAHRQRGEFGLAEDAYRQAGNLGCDPQPGLALLRMAQGNGDAAVAAIRRAVGEATDPLRRAGMLPAYVEIMIAAGNMEMARAGCEELQAISRDRGSDVLTAMAGHSRAALALAEGEPNAALTALRSALEVWHQLGAAYEAARGRVLLGLACRALGDEDTAALELVAARTAFAQMGAKPDASAAAALVVPGADRNVHGLTARERDVLRLVAAGTSNREIAAALVISEHTVARHVQNIFAKLGVSSRTAAAAFAYANDLA